VYKPRSVNVPLSVLIEMAWQCVFPEVTVKGCISCALGGTCGALWSGSAEDGRVRNECERDGGTDTDWYR
jgi:hypothetical protein